MEENTKKTIIIGSIVVLILIVGTVIYVTKFRNKKDDTRGQGSNTEQVDNYVEDRLMNLDEVVKKDKSLIQTALRHVPYKNGIYQTIYGKETVRLENITKELLFNKAYDEGVDKIKDNDLYNQLKSDNGIELVDFFVKEEDILKNIKKIYNIDVTDLPNEVELIGGSAKKYGEYYGFLFASEGYGYTKISKVLSYTISDNNLVIYEKPAFVDYDFETETVYVYSDDKATNLVLTIENESSSTSDNVIKKIKENLSLFTTYEIYFIKNGDNYYWDSVGPTKEGK